jgi:hypothetical protein
MALGRKGSRRIVSTARPTVGGCGAGRQALCWSPYTYAVEQAERPGTILVVTTNQPHASNSSGGRPNLAASPGGTYGAGAAGVAEAA